MDDVVVFRPLSRDDLGRIVDLQLDHLRRLLGDRKIGLEVTTEAKRLVAEECGALLRGIFLERRGP